MGSQFDDTKGSNPFDSANSKRNFLLFSLSRQNPFDRSCPSEGFFNGRDAIRHNMSM